MLRLSRFTHGPPVIDEKIGKATPSVLREEVSNVHFYLVRVLVLREP